MRAEGPSLAHSLGCRQRRAVGHGSEGGEQETPTPTPTLPLSSCSSCCNLLRLATGPTDRTCQKQSSAIKTAEPDEAYFGPGACARKFSDSAPRDDSISKHATHATHHPPNHPPNEAVAPSPPLPSPPAIGRSVGRWGCWVWWGR